MKTIEINKKNLLYNLAYIKTKTKAKIAAVVKANAYGHGIKEICQILKNKVSFFCVANLEEGLQIREFDTTTKILIMGKCDNYIIASKNNLSVTIFNLEELKTLKKRLKKIQTICVHLKINTGMNRIGFSKLEDFHTAIKQISKLKKISLEGVFTHFATLRNDIPYFRQQQKQFETFLQMIPKNKKPIIHGGGSYTSMFTNHYDMIRCGIFLYGYGSNQFKKVMKVISSIVHTDYINKDISVGYSHSYISDKAMKIGVLPIGYNDGIPRNFIGQTMIFKNKSLKILSVCMDMTILEIPDAVKINDIISVFTNAKTWAKLLRTNEHDVLVRFTNFRGKRVIK